MKENTENRPRDKPDEFKDWVFSRFEGLTIQEAEADFAGTYANTMQALNADTNAKLEEPRRQWKTTKNLVSLSSEFHGPRYALGRLLASLGLRGILEEAKIRRRMRSRVARNYKAVRFVVLEVLQELDQEGRLKKVVD